MSVSVCRSLAQVEQGRSKMYVCFGLSLARSGRARTIDLQCKSLSLSSIFALQRVSASAPNRQELCRSLASSLAKSIACKGDLMISALRR